eukprot:4675582-Pyramimonas_sp.AAC.1
MSQRFTRMLKGSEKMTNEYMALRSHKAKEDYRIKWVEDQFKAYQARRELTRSLYEADEDWGTYE